MTVPNAQFQDVTLQHLASKGAICDSKIQHAQARYLTQHFELAHLQSGRTLVCRFAVAGFSQTTNRDNIDGFILQTEFGL